MHVKQLALRSSGGSSFCCINGPEPCINAPEPCINIRARGPRPCRYGPEKRLAADIDEAYVVSHGVIEASEAAA